MDNDHRRVSDRIPAYALYIDPPLGHVGMSETQVRDAGKNALIATMPMSSVGRAVEKGETLGFMKILVDADTKKILGASILGTGGDEVVHSILDVMYAKAPYTVIERAMHIHPTVSELIPTHAREPAAIGDEAKHVGKPEQGSGLGEGLRPRATSSSPTESARSEMIRHNRNSTLSRGY